MSSVYHWSLTKPSHEPCCSRGKLSKVKYINGQNQVNKRYALSLLLTRVIPNLWFSVQYSSSFSSVVGKASDPECHLLGSTTINVFPLHDTCSSNCNMT